MFHFTYMTVDENSGKYYVGRHSTNDLFDGYKGSGKWVRFYPKGKKQNLFTYVLEFFSNEQELKIGEQKLLNEYFQKPLCMNFNNRAEGFATGKNNPTNLLTEEQKKYRSDNHWAKTEEGSKWISENNPSKLDYVKVKRSEKQKELWLQEEYRNNLVGDNHWTNSNSESAKLFRDKMLSDLNPSKTEEVKEKIRLKTKEQIISGNFVLLDPEIQKLAADALRKKYKERKDAGLSAFSEEHIKNLSKPQKIVECPHCGKNGGIASMHRYHFDNCKQLLEAIK